MEVREGSYILMALSILVLCWPFKEKSETLSITWQSDFNTLLQLRLHLALSSPLGKQLIRR